MDSATFVIAIASLVIAAGSLSILVIQERRARRERPRATLEVNCISHMTRTGSEDEERWEIFDLTNTSSVGIYVRMIEFRGVAPRFSGEPIPGFVAPGPRMLSPHESVQMLAKGDPTEAWVRIMWVPVLASKVIANIEWFAPVTGTSISEEHWAQFKAETERPGWKARLLNFVDRRDKWVPKRVGPGTGGITFASSTKKRAKRFPDFAATVLALPPDDEG